MFSGSKFITLLTPGIKDNTRLFQSITAVAGTVWIRLPANLQTFIIHFCWLLLSFGIMIFLPTKPSSRPYDPW